MSFKNPNLASLKQQIKINEYETRASRNEGVTSYTPKPCQQRELLLAYGYLRGKAAPDIEAPTTRTLPNSWLVLETVKRHFRPPHEGELAEAYVQAKADFCKSVESSLKDWTRKIALYQMEYEARRRLARTQRAA